MRFKSPEEKLLIYCARKNVSPEIAQNIYNLAKNSLDWGKLLRKAAFNKLIPLLHLNLNLYCADLIPAEIQNFLKKTALEIEKNNFLFAAELIKFLHVLKRDEIIAVPFKGHTLASLAYDDIGLRQFGDIDIFISKCNVLKTQNILLKNGYRALNNFNHVNFDLLTKAGRHITVTKNGVKFEIHWKIESEEFRFNEQHANRFLYSETIETDLFGVKVPSFSIENLILMLALHCSNHRWATLSMLCDIAILSEKHSNINWNSIIKKAKNFHMEKILATTFYLIDNLMNFKISAEMQSHINRMSKTEKLAHYIQKKVIFSECPIGFLTKLSLIFKNKDTFLQGLKGTFYFIFTPTEEELSIALPKSLTFLRFIFRPFFLLKKFVKVQALGIVE